MKIMTKHPNFLTWEEFLAQVEEIYENSKERGLFEDGFNDPYEPKEVYSWRRDRGTCQVQYSFRLNEPWALELMWGTIGRGQTLPEAFQKAHELVGQKILEERERRHQEK